MFASVTDRDARAARRAERARESEFEAREAEAAALREAADESATAAAAASSSPSGAHLPASKKRRTKNPERDPPAEEPEETATAAAAAMGDETEETGAQREKEKQPQKEQEAREADMEEAAAASSADAVRGTAAAAAPASSSGTEAGTSQCALWYTRANTMHTTGRARQQRKMLTSSPLAVPACARRASLFSLSSVPSASLSSHQRRCLGQDLQACSSCEEPIQRTDIVEHEACCLDRRIRAEAVGDRAMRAERTRMKSSGMLNSQQLLGLYYAEQNASALSAAAFPALMSRVEKLGFTRSDLLKALAFVRDRAPIVVHFDLGGDESESQECSDPHPASKPALMRDALYLRPRSFASDRGRPAVHRSWRTRIIDADPSCGRIRALARSGSQWNNAGSADIMERA